ncbi:MAG: LysM peptidoglycan-binding domain-containing protein [Verrucomicrobiales bacterium]|nr:LysM peptidoglycan-binding domain-containing protein [Verrucomicrobiales bacterium]
MNRIATTLTTAAAFGLLFSNVEAADPGAEQINSRLTKIEKRLATLEESLANRTGSHQYTEQATLDATNGNKVVETKTSPSKTYVIKDGDTLGSIAREHGVERNELLSANRLSEGQPIYIGETLMIPGVEVAVTEPAPKKPENTTKPADATKKSVVVGETKKEERQGATFHVVSKGDTLTAIAKKHGTDVPSLKAANGLKSDTISLGQKLTIPSASTSVAAKTETADQQDAGYEYENPLLKTDETYGYYTVRKGDNLYALARDFFSSMSELQRLNRLGSSTLIHPGDELIVPTGEFNAYHNTGEMAQR